MKLSIEQTEAIAPPSARALNRRAEAWRDPRGRISAYGEIRGDQYWIHLPGLASFSFSRRGEYVAAALTKAVREELVVDAFHRKILPMALQVCGREVLHASAVRAPAGVTAFCGLAETGKSTVAFGLSRRGYPLWADDTVAFEVSPRRSSAVSLPFSMRLRPSAAKVFDVDPNRPSHTQTDILPGAETVPLAAVCILRRLNGAAPAVAVRRLGLAEAFAALLDHSCCFTPQDGERKRRMIHNYLDLAAQTPIFDISFQPGFENFPALLDTIEGLSGKLLVTADQVS